MARLRNHRLGDGSWPGQVNPTAFGVLALSASGSRGGLARSAAWLRSAQNPDGGWGFAGGPPVTPTAPAPRSRRSPRRAARRAIVNGVGWLRRSQAPGGGFAVAGGTPNAQSTAWAVQGLVAGGVSPAAVRNGGSPLDYLASVRAHDGHYRYSAASDQTPVWVTGPGPRRCSRQGLPPGTGCQAAGRRRGPGERSGRGKRRRGK